MCLFQLILHMFCGISSTCRYFLHCLSRCLRCRCQLFETYIDICNIAGKLLIKFLISFQKIFSLCFCLRHFCKSLSCVFANHFCSQNRIRSNHDHNNNLYNGCFNSMIPKTAFCRTDHNNNDTL